jgi:ElaB/YqjD/DUF883 family membrane-anchored ribosome-binding protein
MTDKTPTAAATESSDGACSAAEALQRAKAELEKAQAFYERLRRQTAEQVKAVREKSVADLIDGALNTVKRHPGAGVTLAAVLGFFLGRMFRR